MNSLLPALLLFCWLSFCSTSEFDVAWERYLNQTVVDAPHGLQSGCVPRRFKPQGPYRGLVLLLHGYSACPQQYDQLGPLLAADGMDVIVPLIPGHGNVFDNSGPIPPRWKCPLNDCNGPLDDTTNLPTDPSGYVKFVTLVNSMAALAAPPRAVAGLSVGGAIAAYAGQAMSDGQALYARQLIMNPLLDGAKHKSEVELKILNSNPITRRLWMGWGQGCRDERAKGRAGFCTFQVQHVMASGDFGLHNTLSKFKAPSNTSVAVMYDQGDPVVLTSAVRELADKYRKQVTAGPVQSCVLNFTQHSMLSKWDDVGVNRWWTNELYCDITQYLVRGVPFTISAATNHTEGGEHYCYLGCTATSCKYNISAPVRCPYKPALPLDRK